MLGNGGLDGPAVTVLNSDRTFATIIPIGIGASSIAAGSDGNIYVGAASTVLSINSQDYSLGSADLGSSLYLSRMITNPTRAVVGSVAIAAVGIDPEGNSYARGVTIIPAGSLDTPSTSEAPTSLRGLFNKVQAVTDDPSTGGIAVQTVHSGSTGPSKLIVYLGGTKDASEKISRS